MKLRRGLAAASLAFTAGIVVAGPAPFACAGPGPDATLVVDTGSSEQFLCIALDADSVSGLHLIELAGQQHGLSYSFGYQGQAVCMLAGVGSNEEECFSGGEPFWGYWRASGSSWTWSGTGAGGTVVEDGDVEGWSWGTGNDGGSHQQPPMTSHEAVCGPEQPEKPDGDDGGPKGGGGNGGDKPGSGGGGNGADDPNDGPSTNSSDGTSSPGGEPEDGSGQEEGDEAKDEKQRGENDRKKDSVKKKEDSADNDPAAVATSMASDPTPSSAPAASSSDAPPVAGIIGLGVAIAFGLAGAWFVKRRHLPQA
jgi:hypothetical protein